MVNATSRPLYPPGKTQHSLYRRLAGWADAANLVPPPLGFDPWTVQPVASLYTYYAIPATCLLYTSSFRKHAPSDCFLTKTWDAFLVSITRATLLYRSGSVFTSRFLWRWLYSGTTRWSSPLCRRKRDVSRIRREIRRGQWTAETHNRTGSGS